MRFFLFLFFISFCKSSGSYTPKTFPDSFWDPGSCGLRTPGWACDPDKVLGDHIVEELNIALTNIRQNTNCTCKDPEKCHRSPKGFTISVAILEKIKDDDDIINPSTDHKLKLAEVFANALRIRQNRGHCGDDILIVLSRSDGVIYTSLGMTAAKFLTPEVIQGTDKKIKSKLEKQEYFEALSEMILTFEDALENSMKGRSQSRSSLYWFLWAIEDILVLVIVFVICVIFHCCRNRNT